MAAGKTKPISFLRRDACQTSRLPGPLAARKHRFGAPIEMLTINLMAGPLHRAYVCGGQVKSALALDACQTAARLMTSIFLNPMRDGDPLIKRETRGIALT
jgi:hypothetical protein